MDTTDASAPDGRPLVKTRHPGIYKRGEGYVVRFRDLAGKQRQRGNLKTLAEARRVRAELNADVSRGEYRADTKITFAAYAEAWADTYAGRTNRGLRPETLEEYRRDIKPAIAYFGRMRLAEVSPQTVKEYVRHLEQKGQTDREGKTSPLKSATVRRKLAPLKALFATAVEEGILRSSPTVGLRIGSSQAEITEQAGEEQVKALSTDELGRLVLEVPEGWQRLMVSLLAQSGLRLSEALGLRWQDVDTTERRIRVRQRIRSGEAGAPKSQKSRREVPISSALARELAAHRLATPWSTAERYVFSGDTGKPRDSRNLYRWFKPAAERAGVEWAGFHTLRHTAASRWLQSGVTIAQVARLLGHHDPGFTLRVYISVMPADLPDGDALAAAVGLD